MGRSPSLVRFRLEIFPALGGGFLVRTHSADGAEGNAPLSFSLPLSEVEALARDNPVRAGEVLFEALFQGETLILFERSIQLVEGTPRAQLRLELIFDPHDPKVSVLQALPWELMRRTRSPEVIVLSRRTSLVRYLTVPYSVRATVQPETLRVLVVAPDPRLSSFPLLDLAGERLRLEKALAGSPEIRLVFLSGEQTLAAVRDALVEQEFHILHFMGHGGRREDSTEQVLYFEGSRRAPDPVNGSTLATKLSDLPSLRLVVLNACESGKVGTDFAPGSNSGSADGFRALDGLATSLVLGRLPAVLAMQRTISDSAAIAWSGTFYRRLAAGDTIDAAIAEGRQAMNLANREGFEWATPVSFLRTATGELFPKKDLKPEGAEGGRQTLLRLSIVLALPTLLISAFLINGWLRIPDDRVERGSRDRLEELRRLGLAHRKEEIQRLTLALKSDDPTARRQAAENLVPYGQDAAEELTKSIDEESAVIASNLMAEATRGNLFGLLVIMSNENQWRTPFIEDASRCLVQIGTPSIPFILDELGSESVEAERMLADAKAQQPPSQNQDLVGAFKQWNSLLQVGGGGMRISIARETFASVLREIGEPAVPQLLDALSTPRTLVRGTSLQVLSQIPGAKGRTVQRLRQIAGTLRDPNERKAYLEAAQQLERPLASTPVPTNP